jgi:GNAT superfamily N-acetyltransferase
VGAAGVDRRLLHRWVQGWALSRGLAPPEPAYSGWRVHVGLPDQTARYVLAEAGAGLQAAARDIDQPHIPLKVCATPERLAASLYEGCLSEGWRLQQVSAFMGAALSAPFEPRIDPPYQLTTRGEVAVWCAEVRLPGMEVAAGGRMTLVDDAAVFDRIETHPDHRRRGLGRAVMQALAGQAVAAGASQGLLVATPDGQALYETLGWRVLSPYVTAVRS